MKSSGTFDKCIFRCLITLSFILLLQFITVPIYAQELNFAQIDRSKTHSLLPARINGLPIYHFLHSKSFNRVLKKETMKHEHRYGVCDAPIYQGRVHISNPLLPWSIPKFGVVPQWIETIKFSGCKGEYSRKVLIAVVNDAPRIYPILPGNAISLIDFDLHKDLMETLITSERQLAINEGCKQDIKIRIHNTHLHSYSQKGEQTSWEEGWHISNCRSEKVLKINFTTNPTTGTYFEIHQPAPEQIIAKDTSSYKVKPQSPN